MQAYLRKVMRELSGKGIGVAVLDTGAYPHIDFEDRIWAFRDYIHGREQAYDDNGHGTHVLGILGGNGTASGGKYRGTAFGCGLIPIKVLDEKGNGNKEMDRRKYEPVSYPCGKYLCGDHSEGRP